MMASKRPLFGGRLHAAQLKEVVRDADRVDLQQLAPNRRDHFFQIRLRLHRLHLGVAASWSECHQAVVIKGPQLA